MASPKKSALYYWAEENGQIPWWTLLCSLPQLPSYVEFLWNEMWRQIETHLDRRRTTSVVPDDYVVRRYGQTAYLANYFHPNAHGGMVWGNVLVDTVICHGELSYPMAFNLHERGGPLKMWERGLAQVQRVQARLQAAGVRPDRLWTVADCRYGNAAMAAALRARKGFYHLGIPKNRTVELFGRSQRLDHYFASLPQRQLTVASKPYRYKLSTANLKDWGCHRLLAVWDSRGR